MPYIKQVLSEIHLPICNGGFDVNIFRENDCTEDGTIKKNGEGCPIIEVAVSYMMLDSKLHWADDLTPKKLRDIADVFLDAARQLEKEEKKIQKA